MNGSSRRIAPALASLALTLAGCASVAIHKIDAQGHASGPDGIRFYMPRPYVCVNEPFVVAARAYLVNGRLSTDGTHVLIDDVDGDLDGHFKATGTPRDLDASAVRAIPAIPTPPVRSPAGAEQAAIDAPGAPTLSTTDAAPDSGRFDFRLTNDNAAYALTPRPRFDILWLPDFDEQYVLSTKAALGNAQLSVATGQGWSLQGIDAHIDNSAVTGRMLALYDESFKILSQLGRTALLGPAGALPFGGTEQGATTTAAQAFDAGAPLTVKVTVVRVVAPGLYPILKPDEMRPLEDPDTLGAIDDRFAERVLVPVPPLTNIAFDTYEVLVVEAARAHGDSPMQLERDARASTSTTGTPLASAAGADPFTTAIRLANDDLATQALPGAAHWIVTTLQPDPTDPTGAHAVVRPSTTGPLPGATTADVRAAINAALAAAGSARRVTADTLDIRTTP